MDIVQALILAVVQGLTEFLPISSSAHLILVPILVDWPDQGLAFDVAVHVGTLSAVVFYFRHELQKMAGSCLVATSGGEINREVRLLVNVIIATVPAALIGAIFHDQIDSHLRQPLVIAAATIVFGLVLLLANQVGDAELLQAALQKAREE